MTLIEYINCKSDWRLQRATNQISFCELKAKRKSEKSKGESKFTMSYNCGEMWRAMNTMP